MIDASYQKISAIGTKLENHTVLLELILSGNEKFTLTQSDIDNLRSDSLQKLSLDKCGIQMIPGTFEKLSSLLELNLADNQLTTIPSNLFKNNQLFKSLSLNGNKGFAFLKNTILLENVNQIEFFCNDCGIKVINNETFSKLPNLKRIQLRNNLITEIGIMAFQENSKLNALYLDGNQLSELSIDIFKPTTILKEFCLDGNPFIPSKINNELKLWYSKNEFRKQCNQTNPFEKRLTDWHQFTGISDAFIASYLTLIVIIQGVFATLLIMYFVKQVYRKSNEFDYSVGILNDHDIYKAY